MLDVSKGVLPPVPKCLTTVQLLSLLFACPIDPLEDYRSREAPRKIFLDDCIGPAFIESHISRRSKSFL